MLKHQETLMGTTVYRADIDGLRALAVMLVVLFHAFPKTFRSGFIGVDLFFVISGYLISSILFKQLGDGSFTFGRFYQRRIQRIFPSLILVLTVSILGAFVLFLSSELAQLGKHLLAAATFSSNFVLWNESGYFDNSSDTKPYLHLWSLAIEEQYYLLFPVFLYLLRFRGHFFGPILLLAGLSFAVNIFVISNRVADYYFPFARFWELLIGALLASVEREGRFYLNPSKRAFGPDLLRQVLSLGGGALLAGGILFIHEDSLFPGYWALLPTVGATAMLAAGPNGFLNRWIFSRSFPVWIGKISYALYLWHWVIFSFARVIEGAQANIYMRLLMVTLSVLLAWLTTRFWENPIRFGAAHQVTAKKLVLALVGLGLLGGITWGQKGFPKRDSLIQEIHIAHGDLGHDEFHSYHLHRFKPCASVLIHKNAPTWNGMTRCFQSREDQAVDTVIIGDSHAEHLFLGLAESLPKKNLAYYIKAELPLKDHPEFREIFSEVISNPAIKTVLIAAFWQSRGMPIEPLSRSIQSLLDAGKRVFLVDDQPSYGHGPDNCKFTRLLRGSTRCFIERSEFESKNRSVLEALQELKQRHPAINLLRTIDFFCGPQRCEMIQGQSIIYRDSNHLNKVGSRALGQYLVRHYPDLSVP